MEELTTQQQQELIQNQIDAIKEQNRLLKKSDDDHEKRLETVERMMEEMDKTIKDSTIQLRELNKFLQRFNINKAKLIGIWATVSFFVVGVPALVLTYLEIYDRLFGG